MLLFSKLGPKNPKRAIMAMVMRPNWTLDEADTRAPVTVCMPIEAGTKTVRVALPPLFFGENVA